jgi:hypothetical protein
VKNPSEWLENPGPNCIVPGSPPWLWSAFFILCHFACTRASPSGRGQAGVRRGAER